MTKEINITPYTTEYIGYQYENVRELKGFLAGLEYHQAIPQSIRDSLDNLNQAIEFFYKLNNAVIRELEKRRKHDR